MNDLAFGRLVLFESKLSLEVCSSAVNEQVADLACKEISGDFKYSKFTSRIWIPISDYYLPYSITKITCKDGEKSIKNCPKTYGRRICNSVSVLICSKSMIETSKHFLTVYTLNNFTLFYHIF